MGITHCFSEEELCALVGQLLCAPEVLRWLMELGEPAPLLPVIDF